MFGRNAPEEAWRKASGGRRLRRDELRS
jgi:hypothetical protein